jgi:uncharacterized membrane protein
MIWSEIRNFLILIQHGVSVCGIFIIISGVVLALGQYFYAMFATNLFADGAIINSIRLRLGRSLILGLEFIVAADLIGTTTTPDYYAVGLAAIIVAIRTLLSFSLNKELMALSEKNN